MSLVDALLSVPEREAGGSISAARLKYQAQWALALIFDLHQMDGDYAVAVEFHDDVVVLNDSNAPTRISFFQVKTKANGSWSVPAIFRRAKGRDGKPLLSFMGKLYSNLQSFPEHTESLNYVSNTSYSFVQKDKATLKDCAPEIAEEFRTRLAEEFPDVKDEHCQLFNFIRTDLSLGDADVHTQGKLTQFVQQTLGDVIYSPVSFYRLLVDEIQRRSNTKADVTDLPELLRAKAITRANVDGWLKTVEGSRNKPKWEDVSQQILCSASEYAALRRVWARYEVEVLNSADVPLLRVRTKIRSFLDTSPDYTTFEELLAAGVSTLQDAARALLPTVDVIRLKVMILYEVLDYEPGTEIQAIGTQSQETQ